MFTRLNVYMVNKSQLKTAISAQPKTEWFGACLGGATWNVYQGDALAVLRGLPAGHFHCVVTSPPYYWLRDYGTRGQIGHEESVAGYVGAIAAVMDEVHRVLRKDGVLFLNIGDTYYSGKGKSHGIDPKSAKRRFGLRAVDKSGGLGIGLRPKSIIGIPWRVAVEMCQRKWVLRSAIIWHRKNALTESVKDRPRRSYENIFMFSKDRNYFFNRAALRDVIVEEDVWSISARPKPTNGIDTAPYPDELVERCLALGCPEKGNVLDPFAGGGTTLRVALATGRSATGIDLSPAFCEYMSNNLRSLL
ncbi:MAG: DNA-methyltransferase [Sulfobacillus sp.]